MSKRSHRLPFGGRTVDVDEYIHAWNDIAAPLVDILGWRLCALDPGFTFEDSSGERAELTVKQTYEIAKNLREK